MRALIIIVYLCLCTALLHAQEHLSIHTFEAGTNLALPYVTITNNAQFVATTDSTGNATVSLSVGSNKLHFSFTGHAPLDTIITLPASFTMLNIALTAQAEALDEVTIVSTTRNDQGIENSPLKVEVLGLQEMKEEAAIKPGNIASILGDVSGVQIQQSSPISGNSNVRIQGLDGRYTQVLRDGMPLYDGFAGGFGILTIPPLDLKQIELVKGSASTLYGGGAIGGLINLVSKKPGLKQEVDALVNYTTLNELNANLYVAKRGQKFGYTLFTGYTHQLAKDVDGDGFSDVPDVNSVIIHPKVFWYPNTKTIISVGYSGSFDDRKGGDIQVLNGRSDAIHRYYEQDGSKRHTPEYSIDHFFDNNIKLTIKGNASYFDRATTTDIETTQGHQLSYYSEASIVIPKGKNSLVAGINVTGNNYNTIRPDTALLKSLENLTAGAFAQYSMQIRERTTLEGGMRLDVHDRYGLFALPRVAVFHRFTGHWAARAGFGMGYKTPDPLVQQNIEYRITDMLPLSSTVKPELSYGYNAEINYKKEWDNHTTLFINQAFFLTQLNDPILFFDSAASGKVTLINASASVVTKGSDTYVKLSLHSWELYLGYTYTDARNTYLPANTFVPLTPANRLAFVVTKELEEKWRFGLEGSYIGEQYRYDATRTPSYFIMALMIQRKLGKHVSLVLNGENLLDERMSRTESLYTGSVTNPIFKPLWAPVDGRVVNLSLRWKL